MARPVAVVTGAARGIGLETARRLRPPIASRCSTSTPHGVERAAAGLGDADLGALRHHRPRVDRRGDRPGRGRVRRHRRLHLQRGHRRHRALRHLDPDVLAAQLNVNLTGNWRLIHACLPHVIARRGYVLGVASLAAIVAPLGIGAYGASKAGLEQLLNVLRMEVRHLGVDVGVAYFSWIDTDMVRGAENSHPGFAAMRKGLRGPAGKTLPVGDAADAIVRGVQRRSRRVVAPGFVGALFRLRGLDPRADRP